jgi:hypothetical protein
VKDGRWVTIADSQFPHERQGLEAVKQLLPDAPPFRAWANFEFRDSRGMRSTCWSSPATRFISSSSSIIAASCAATTTYGCAMATALRILPSS